MFILKVLLLSILGGLIAGWIIALFDIKGMDNGGTHYNNYYKI